MNYYKGMLISNHSYGESVSTSSNWYIGAYSTESRNWDEIAYNAPYYLTVLSAGNDGNATNPQPTLAGYDKLVGYALSKNPLVIANAENANIDANGNFVSAVIEGTSSEGPADDGRIKPDIAGDGKSVYSTSVYPTAQNNTTYRIFTGTSMSAPNVTGTLMLLQQHYNDKYSRYMKAETLKSVAIHTADDFENPGPDAKVGWGYLNGKACIEAIDNNGDTSYISENVLADGQTYTYTVNAEGGGTPLSVSVVWTDPAGDWVNDETQTVNNTRAALVNDLDVRVTNGANTYYPWKLSTANVAAPATRNSDNNVDNVENVLIDVPAAGTYTVTVTHKGTLVNNKQSFAIIATGLSSSSFAFTTQDNDETVCDTTDAVFNFDYEQKSAGTTSFSATNMPGGMTVSFNNVTMSATGTLTATFSDLTDVAPGKYNVFIEGANGSDVERRSVFIEVFSDRFSNTVAVSPLNGASTGNYQMDLVWEKDVNALSSVVELSSDINFATILQTVNSTDNTATVSGLVEGNVYYWRVIGTNNCGTAVAPFNVHNFQVGQQNCVAESDATGWAIPEGTFLNIDKVVANDFIISDLNVSVVFTHQYLSDVDISLQSPAGTRVKLLNALVTPDCAVNGSMSLKFDNVGGSAYNCTAQSTNYPTVYTLSPDEDLTSFIGESTVGTWRLILTDLYGGDLGNLISFELEFCQPEAITPLPSLIRNNPITIAPLASHVYSNANDLEVTSASETASQQVYTVVELPTNGEVRLSNAVLSLGDSFTQNDINSDNITYQNTSGTGNLIDGFTVNIINNANGWLSNERIVVNVDSALSVSENELEQIAVYPNPASSIINIATLKKRRN